MKRFKETLEFYTIEHSQVLNIQIIIYNEITEKLVLRKNKFNSKSLGENKDLINISKVSEAFNKMLPLTTNEKDFG